LEQVWYKNKTVYFPMISMLLVTFLSIYLATKYNQRNFHFILFYYGLASLYGYGAYEKRYAKNKPQHPILCSITYTLCWVPQKLLFPFKSSAD